MRRATANEAYHRALCSIHALVRAAYGKLGEVTITREIEKTEREIMRERGQYPASSIVQGEYENAVDCLRKMG